MEELVKLVDALRGRIEAHSKNLRTNEALTRAVLVDPLLRALGWNTEDPAQVVPEFSIPDHKAKSADYALFARANRPDVIIEAKKLGEPLAEAARQALSYCTQDGFPFFVVTDGQSWNAYETLRPGKLEAKRVATFDVCSGSAEMVALTSLFLWRPRFVSALGVEAAVQVTAPMVAEPTSSKSNILPSSSVDPSTGSTPRASSGNGQPSVEAAWYRLSDFEPMKYAKPQAVRLPSGDIVTLKTWREVAGTVVEHLAAQGKLVGATVPIQIGKRYIVATKPQHPNGSRFRSQLKVGPYFVETHYSAKAMVGNTRTIIERVGLDASTFALRLKGV